MMAEKISSRADLFLAARVLAALFMLLCIAIFILSVFEYPAVAAAHPQDFTLWAWSPREMDIVMGQISLSYRFWLQWDRFTSIVFASVFGLIGTFLFLRKSTDWFGLYVAVTLVLYGTLYGSAASIASTIYPRLEPLLTPLSVIAWVALFVMLFLFPNGRFVPRWTWMVVLGIFIAFGVTIIAYHGGQPPAPVFIPLFALVMVGPISQVYRYRKVSNIVEQQQTKLVLLAMVVVIIVLLISGLPLMLGLKMDPATPRSLFFALISSIGTWSIGLIPLSIGLAVLRYRLWDIDVIIRRTLMYTGMTFTLGLVYFGSVVLFQQALGTLTGNSTLAIVLSTLLIAALFEPVRRRMQSFMDRRFYRQKYDAALALEEFSGAARREVALDRLTAQMVSVVEKTVQPEQVSVWLRERKAQE